MTLTQEAEKLIALAIAEDIGDGDHSSLASIPASENGKAELLVKENGILAGLAVAEKIAQSIDPTLSLKSLKKDGDSLEVGEVVFSIEGNVQKILQAERLMLNFLQRMSGIATKTREYAELCEGTKATVLDTRKTTPGLRFFEKWAVMIGGGQNHRSGLFDMVMLKDNHIDYAGGIAKALKKTKAYLEEKGKDLKIEIETRNIEEVGEVLDTGIAHRIMLDNFSVSDTKIAVDLIGDEFETESSGGITKQTIRNYAECGVDFVSVGALTHHIRSLDLSLKASA